MDSFFITFNDGSQDFHANSACFAPLNRYRERMKFMGQDGKENKEPCSLTYLFGCNDERAMSKWVGLLRRVPQFAEVIINAFSHKAYGSITVDLHKPIADVMYTLGAFRLIQEYPEELQHIKKIMELRCSELNPAFMYLLAENLTKDDDRLHWCEYNRGHSNRQSTLSYQAVYDFCFKGGGMLGGKSFVELLSYEHGWGNIKDKKCDRSFEQELKALFLRDRNYRALDGFYEEFKNNNGIVAPFKKNIDKVKEKVKKVKKDLGDQLRDLAIDGIRDVVINGIPAPAFNAQFGEVPAPDWIAPLYDGMKKNKKKREHHIVPAPNKHYQTYINGMLRMKLIREGERNARVNKFNVNIYA